MSRRSRPFAAFLAILALLFAQAMASVHACGDFKASTAAFAAAAAAAVPHDGDCCDPATPQPDSACDNHCQQAKQAPERVQVSSVMPPLAIAFVIPAALALPQAPPAPVTAAPDLARDTQPPISIRNCCFRI